MDNFKNIVKDNQNNVRSIIRLITKETNEDLEQEVYVKVWKNSEKYKEQGVFKSWINTIAKDYLKSKQKRYADDAGADDEIFNNIKDKKDTPELRLIKNDRHEKIMSAVNSLKPKFKEVVMLCEIYGYTYEDASNRLKCPIGTIKSRLYNAKKELAIILKDLL